MTVQHSILQDYNHLLNRFYHLQLLACPVNILYICKDCYDDWNWRHNGHTDVGCWGFSFCAEWKKAIVFIYIRLMFTSHSIKIIVMLKRVIQRLNMGTQTLHLRSLESFPTKSAFVWLATNILTYIVSALTIGHHAYYFTVVMFYFGINTLGRWRRFILFSFSVVCCMCEAQMLKHFTVVRKDLISYMASIDSLW